MEEPCGLANHAGGATQDQVDGPQVPVFAESLGQRRNGPPQFGRRDFFKDIGEHLAIKRDQEGSHGGRIFRRSDLAVGLHDFIPEEQEGEGVCRLKPLAFEGFLAGEGQDLREARVGYLEFREVFEDEIEGRDLVPELACPLQGAEEFVRMRDGGLAEFEWIVLFEGDHKVTVLFEGVFGSGDPAFEVGFGKDLRDEHLGDLREGCPASEALEDLADHTCWIRAGAFPESGRVFRTVDEDMIVWDDRERFGCVLELHGMPLFPREIDGDLAEQKVDGIHLPETPAFVGDEDPWVDFFKGGGGGSGEFSGFDSLLDFRGHEGFTIGRGRGRVQGKSGGVARG